VTRDHAAQEGYKADLKTQGQAVQLRRKSQEVEITEKPNQTKTKQSTY